MRLVVQVLKSFCATYRRGNFYCVFRITKDMHWKKLKDCTKNETLHKKWNNAQKMKFSIEDFFSKCDQIRRNLPIWSHLLKKSLMENFIFCAVKKGDRRFELKWEAVNSLAFSQKLKTQNKLFSEIIFGFFSTKICSSTSLTFSSSSSSV